MMSHYWWPSWPSEIQSECGFTPVISGIIIRVQPQADILKSGGAYNMMASYWDSYTVWYGPYAWKIYILSASKISLLSPTKTNSSFILDGCT